MYKGHPVLSTSYVPEHTKEFIESRPEGTPRETVVAVPSAIPAGLPNGVWTIQGPRGHRTFRISTILKDDTVSTGPMGNASFRAKHAGKRILELLVGPDNTSSYRGLAWYDGGVGNRWKFGQQNVILIAVFVQLVEQQRPIEGYTVAFARNCYVCNRLLTTPESIERGIGPVCGGRS